MTEALRGVVTPLVTPLTDTGELDEDALGRVADEQLGAGARAVFVGGSTGEVALQPDAVRRRVVEVAVAAAAGRAPVIAGAMDTGTLRVIDHAVAAVEAGAAAVVAAPPFYIAPGVAEVVRHYELIAAAVEVPVVAYDIPAATHSPLPLPALARLAQQGTIAAFKDSSGDLAGFRRALAALRGTGVTALTGSEVFADVAVQLGASGIVPGLGNVDPNGYPAILRAVEAGDPAAAAAEQERLIALFAIIDVADRSRIGFTAGALGAFKAAMWLRGVLDSPRTFAPLSPLTDAEIDRIREILIRAGLAVVR
ncbi:4-hydroxy-tetrahydrodipicolinate synthase [Propionibacteriaceae bacterium ES.041]|uniref:dihydrodipicolinate synthase family protein n=1 Tax=Enemella evansiae TaxID=2016499 RepID=UPI000B960D95|nr:dihydrodipicolinate synthase family protein [Enemella evansiae]OYN96355.1 dihydrodipicolinate synthase family protein [Enemella evansiae]PFG65598.1 4-hydroxy-tetrahydrodipicolinate synthase [Propionibacteriaceae bacterium ES.041]